MKLRWLMLIVMFGLLAPAAKPQQGNTALTKTEVMTLVKFGMNGAELAAKIKNLGIDFEPTDDYLRDLQQAGATEEVLQALRARDLKPLSREQLGQLVAGDVPKQRIAALVQEHGVDFLADEEYLKTLRLAGANDELIAAVQAASAAAVGNIVVHSSPQAEVTLDGNRQGLTDAAGTVAVRTHLGNHALKVTLSGKKDFQQPVHLTSVQDLRIEARLEDLPAPPVVVPTPPPTTPAAVFTRRPAVVPRPPPTAPAAGPTRRPVVSNASSVAGTVWTGMDSYGNHLEYHFQAGGALHWRSRYGFFTNGRWKQTRNSIYMETNKRYAEYHGTIKGNRMEGQASNKVHHHWSWWAEKQP